MWQCHSQRSLDPPLDNGSLLSSCILDALWVILVIGFPQVKVMRCLLNVQDVYVRVADDRDCEAVGCPRVQLANRKDDVGQGLQASLDDFVTKVAPNPMVVGRHLELLLALEGEGIVVERLGN